MTALAFHEEFTALLPQLTRAARSVFRRRNATDQEEAIADTQAAAWSAWSGLIKRGRNPLEVGSGKRDRSAGSGSGTGPLLAIWASRKLA
jgi:hypothetical protein